MADQPYLAYPPAPPPSRPRVVPAPPGTPFHRLGRTPLHRWWRPLVGTLFIAALAVVGALVLMIAMVFPDTSGDPTRVLALNLISLSVLTPIVLVAVRVVQRRPIGSVVSVTGRLRWGWLFTCCGIAVGFCIASLVLSYVTWAIFSGEEPAQATGQWPGWAEFLVPAAVIVLLVPLQATAEEIAFRGWLLQGIAAWTLEGRPGAVSRAVSVVLRTPWVAILGSAALFTSVHGYGGWALLDIFCFAALAGWLAVRTGGLEAGIALHVFINLLGLLLLAASGRMSDSLRQGGEPLTSFLASVLALALYALAVVAVARRRRLQTVSPS